MPNESLSSGTHGAEKEYGNTPNPGGIDRPRFCFDNASILQPNVPHAYPDVMDRWIHFIEVEPLRPGTPNSQTRPAHLWPESNGCPTLHKPSVPHPFAFVLAKGWETSILNQPVHSTERSESSTTA